MRFQVLLGVYLYFITTHHFALMMPSLLSLDRSSCMDSFHFSDVVNCTEFCGDQCTVMVSSPSEICRCSKMYPTFIWNNDSCRKCVNLFDLNPSDDSFYLVPQNGPWPLKNRDIINYPYNTAMKYENSSEVAVQLVMLASTSTPANVLIATYDKQNGFQPLCNNSEYSSSQISIISQRIEFVNGSNLSDSTIFSLTDIDADKCNTSTNNSLMVNSSIAMNKLLNGTLVFIDFEVTSPDGNNTIKNLTFKWSGRQQVNVTIDSHMACNNTSNSTNGSATTASTSPTPECDILSFTDCRVLVFSAWGVALFLLVIVVVLVVVVCCLALVMCRRRRRTTQTDKEDTIVNSNIKHDKDGPSFQNPSYSELLKQDLDASTESRDQPGNNGGTSAYQVRALSMSDAVPVYDTVQSSPTAINNGPNINTTTGSDIQASTSRPKSLGDAVTLTTTGDSSARYDYAVVVKPGSIRKVEMRVEADVNRAGGSNQGGNKKRVRRPHSYEAILPAHMEAQDEEGGKENYSRLVRHPNRQSCVAQVSSGPYDHLPIASAYDHLEKVNIKKVQDLSSPVNDQGPPQGEHEYAVLEGPTPVDSDPHPLKFPYDIKDDPAFVEVKEPVAPLYGNLESIDLQGMEETLYSNVRTENQRVVGTQGGEKAEKTLQSDQEELGTSEPQELYMNVKRS